MKASSRSKGMHGAESRRVAWFRADGWWCLRLPHSRLQTITLVTASSNLTLLNSFWNCHTCWIVRAPVMLVVIVSLGKHPGVLESIVDA
jgi:hypothetical protein